MNPGRRSGRDDEPRPGSGLRSRALRVLIVDHDPATAEILRFLLAPDGHDVFIAQDPDAALTAVRERAPDVALIGIGVPAAPWDDLARRMRIAAGPDMRLIATTGFGSETNRARARRADFDALLEKPESLLELLRQLAPGLGVADET